MKKEQNALKKFLKSFIFSFNGIIVAFKSEFNLRIHFIATIIVVILGFIYKITKYEWFICLILIGIVISSELFNTAIEKTVDFVCPKYSEKAKFIKDTSSAAVLVLALISFIIGLNIFIPKIFN